MRGRGQVDQIADSGLRRFLWRGVLGVFLTPRNKLQGQPFEASITSYGSAAVNALLLEYDLVGGEVLCDIGGGRGALLAGFKEQWSNTTLFLLDLAAPVVSKVPRLLSIGLEIAPWACAHMTTRSV